MLQDA
ncbi:hypothetical protein Tco_0388153, partial [Tanacetum coccineum]